ncbi:hypothetical protein KL86SPO_50002 [uncultured Sporomusa sp.]|uniref:Uncharacterized protein n=1 Tax=uncultured Sporomusa sp. TaxID=307249 RepID=A0A212LXI5_9FIRM|nr:hypothetical protein KL86SPO_50002 [uncultured Sporomusa sp.]
MCCRQGLDAGRVFFIVVYGLKKSSVTGGIIEIVFDFVWCLQDFFAYVGKL